MVTRSESGGLIGYFVRHRTAANLLLVLLVLAGLAAAPQMRVQYLPDIVFDDIDVTVRWDNAGPEEIDRAILGPLLPALRQVDGVVERSEERRVGKECV